MGRPIELEKPRQRRRRRDGAMGGLNQRLAVPAGLELSPEFNYHWFNDEGANLSVAMGKDYEFANEKGDKVDPRSPESFSVHVGSLPNGQPLLAYLMRKYKDWYDDDKKETQDGINEKMNEIQQSAGTDRAKPTGLNVSVK